MKVLARTLPEEHFNRKQAYLGNPDCDARSYEVIVRISSEPKTSANIELYVIIQQQCQATVVIVLDHCNIC